MMTEKVIKPNELLEVDLNKYRYVSINNVFASKLGYEIKENEYGNVMIIGEKEDDLIFIITFLKYNLIKITCDEDSIHIKEVRL